MMKPSSLGLLVGFALAALTNASRRTNRHWQDHQQSSSLQYTDTHRQLRAATICTEDPTAFSTSIFVDHVGDGTPFSKSDVDQLLQMALLSFNQLASETCDATYRTLSSINVGNIYYSDNFDFIRLRYDLEGTCSGCVSADPTSGIGPLFGNAEFEKRRNMQEVELQTYNAETPKIRRGNRIKGQFQNRHRELKSKKQPSICECASDIPSRSQRGPTASEFGVEMNNRITAARSAGTLSGVSYINEIFEAGVLSQSTVLPSAEGQGATCANEQDFTTDIWVEFEQGSFLTDAEKIPMEVALLETFNEMNLVSCDIPFFRKVTDVSYQLTRPSGDKLQMKFRVIGKCVNCDPSSVNLFDLNPSETTDPAVAVNVEQFRAPSTSLLLAEIERTEEFQSGPIVITRDIPVSCTCPLNRDNLPLRSPTTREFSEIFRSSLLTLRNENQLTSVETLVRVEEGDIDAVCSTDVTSFVSTILVDFDGRPSLLQPAEISTLEGGFMESYNQLIFNSCDQYFREISDVTLVPGVSRRRRRRSLQASGVGNAANSSDVPDLQSEAPSVYRIAGECRGCPVTPGGFFSLTDDAFRFRKLMEEGQEVSIATYSYASAITRIEDVLDLRESSVGFHHPDRRLQECTCAAGTLPDAPFAPSPNDFRLDYNVKIAQYNNAGSVTSVSSVTNLVEIPPGLVVVKFSIFYGTLARLGNPAASDYPPLEQQTTNFFRTLLFSQFSADPTLSLQAVTVKWDNTTVRTDLDMLQVDFTAELLFVDNPNLPSAATITKMMEDFHYVDYITRYVWRLTGVDSAFHAAHSVRFAGTESMVTDVRMLFTVRSDRTNLAPNTDDRRGLRYQINRFFLDHLKTSGLFVRSFESHIDAEDVLITANGVVSVDFDATVVFSTEVERPPQSEVQAIILSANLDDLKTQMLTAPRTGSAVFNDPFDIAFDQSPP